MESKFKEGFQDDGKLKILTIPNMLSIFRLCLIPLFIWTYIGKDDSTATFVLLVNSGVTDIVDGFIARHFNMISAFGKALDPIADKLTQAAMLFCLVNSFPSMLLPFILMIFKELFSGVAAFIAIRKTGEVHGADWHGKITTVLLYSMMALHVLWRDIPPILTNIFVGICVIMMLISFVLYSMRNIGMAKKAGKEGVSEEI